MLLFLISWEVGNDSLRDDGAERSRKASEVSLSIRFNVAQPTKRTGACAITEGTKGIEDQRVGAGTNGLGGDRSQ